jgi:hypothetical protein
MLKLKLKKYHFYSCSRDVEVEDSSGESHDRRKERRGGGVREQGPYKVRERICGMKIENR